MSRSLRLIVDALRARPGITAVAIVFAVLAVIMQVVTPLLTGSAIDIATNPAAATETPATRLFDALDPITATVVALIVVALAQYLFNVVRRWAQGRLSLDTQHDVRVRLLATLQRLDGPGQDRIVTGQIASRAISDLGQVQHVVTMFPIALSRLLQLTMTLAIMLGISPRLTLVALVMIPILAATAVASKRRLYAATWVNQQATADLATHVEQTVTGVRVVKAFAQESREIDALDRLGRTLYAVKMRSAKLTARFQPVMGQVPRLALVATIVLGGMMAMRGEITVGVFFIFSTYLTSLTQNVSMLSNTWVNYQLAASSLERIDDILGMAPEHPDYDHPRDAERLPDGPLGLEFEGVDFSTGGHRVLDGLSFSVAPNSSLSVVGPPGSGKSMAVQLAGGFYRPDAGVISLVDADGNRHPYARLDNADVRAAVTVVFDEAFLFSTSVRENIAMGHDYSDDEVRRAATLAQADEFITDLEEGYDTVVGERGLTLSGGQRQRIALARALLARPRILILDDATSAIDAATEKAILDGLRAELEDVTVIAVAHRRSTLALTERVIVIEDGAVNPGAEVLPERSAQPAEPAHARLWPADPPASASPLSLPDDDLARDIDRLPPADEAPRLDSAALRDKRGTFRVRELFAAVRWLIAAAIALMIVGVLADLAFPALMRVAVDRGVSDRSGRTLWAIAGIGVLIVLLAWAAAAATTIITSRSGERLLYGLRLRSYTHLQRLSMDFYETTMAGRVLTRMTTDIDTLSRFLQTALAEAVVSVGTLIGVLALLLTTDLSLSLIALAAVPVVVVATVVFRRVSKRLYTAARQQVSGVNAQFQENISGLRIAQMHAMTGPALASFAEGSDLYRRLRTRATLVVATYFAGMQAVTQITSAAVLGVGAGRVAEDTLTAGILIAFLMYLAQLFGPIQSLGNIFDSWQQASVSFTRITDLLATEPGVADTGTRGAEEAARAVRGPLALERVDFAYTPADNLDEEDNRADEAGVDKRPPALVARDLNLRIDPGTTVALVGPTGAGKSTVVKLLARFYDPVAGRVTADGVDVRDFELAAWRRQIVQVPQEAHLFIGTIADNIRYGLPGASDGAVEEAVRAIGALDVVAAIPGGFHAPVGERGRGLSAGQRQIVALARAELLGPEVLLLDEATATLDPATEAAFLDASARATRGRTSVIVAHRLATAARADRIVVIVKGAVAEHGSHTELLAQGGIYAKMWAIHS